MEGAALAEKNSLNVALFTAWHTALFALNGYGDKRGRMAGGKNLSDLMFGDKPEPSANVSNAQGIAFFMGLKSKGMPVEISRNEIN